MTSAKKPSYHHGNLREALLEAAMDSLAAQSLENLSLRGLAKTLGVTPTAVYSHFEDKVALLVEIRTLGFAQLHNFLNAELEALEKPSPEAKVRTLAHGYMNFAVANPNLFDTLFAWTPDLSRITDDCIQAGTDSEGLLRSALIELLQENGNPPSEYQSAVASFSAWSLIHGVSTLLKSGAIDGAVYCEHWPETFSSAHPESQSKVIEHLITIEIEGIKAAAANIKP